MIKKPSTLLSLSVEQENLAAIPFAILERRVGKRVGKIEIKGIKTLPDGRQMRVVWQVQGNNELGLPTEQDLDIFVALGVLTYRHNFAKTVTFTGRELAQLLNIGSVHGKFYQRLKLAMDRFIPLRFRALSSTDRQEEVKWLNVFQEISIAVDRASGKLTGTATWTDKLIRAMDSGLFRMLDAGKYMELDGITAKHLYRFLVLAFEKTETLIIDARQLATEHLGILTLPKYFSRLMQTLEPAFDQLKRIQVLGSWHVVSADEWRVALRRHPAYEPVAKTLALAAGGEELTRAYCQKALEEAGFSVADSIRWCTLARDRGELYTLGRAARLVEEMKRLEAPPPAAIGLARRAIETGGEAGRDLLDRMALGVEICQIQRSSDENEKLTELLLQIARDPGLALAMLGMDAYDAARRRFRELEEAALRRHQDAEEQRLVVEYEQFRRRLARELFDELPASTREALLREKQTSPREAEERVLEDLAGREVPPFEKWRLRMKAGQAVQPFGSEDAPFSEEDTRSMAQRTSG